MGNLTYITYKRVVKAEWKFLVAFVFILSITIIIAEILFRDINELEDILGPLHNLTGIDKDIFYFNYGNGTMYLQGYCFGFAFFLLLNLVYYFFSTNLLLDNFKKEIVVLKRRSANFNKAGKEYFVFLSLNLIVSLLLSWVLVCVVNIITNSFLKTSVDFLVINPASIITSIVCLIVYLLIIRIGFFIKFNKKRVIKLLREIY